MTALDDVRHMARAVQLARRGLYTTDPNPRVGCVIVRENTVVGEAWHARAGEAHAETLALAQAGDQARGATVYVTLEPCCHDGRTPPCTTALIKAGVAGVVAAMPDPNPRVAGRGFAQLERSGINVRSDVLRSEAEKLNPGFIARMRHGRPYVRVKIAATLDGRTALANGDSKWITGEAARADVQKWRARSSAILTGINTVLKDDPRLDVRTLDIGRQPLRIVLDSRFRMPPKARMLASAGTTLIVAAIADAERAAALQAAGAEVLCLPSDDQRVNLTGLMGHLAACEVNELWVESGSAVCGAFFAAGLVNELVVYYAPRLFGDLGRGMFELPPLDRLEDAKSMKILDLRMIGEDMRVIAQVIGSA